MITGLHHVNILVPPSTLHLATLFYGTTLGLIPRPVPALQQGTLAWFDFSQESSQQLHVALGRPDIDFTPEARNADRHPCFRVGNAEKLKELQERIWEHYKRGGEGAPMECDEPGTVGSGHQGVEYPKRFFARDYAGNRLEFSL